ncbi:Tryptophan synthase beta subunit-like PLP-dependent enzymes superfamily [Corchorus capsularis]|uniref:Tryptophan synthase beta subunit-like PLP-dependent enzymes superfamily n=1 Tax=Corchorus capsularis TaxID=210143 RepID=A0A1R3HGB6_COCAP|nr:Tryptophan synthase beta subunit-like PLP-dependent enzymes superfamily [Corchorus capsularis]
MLCSAKLTSPSLRSSLPPFNHSISLLKPKSCCSQSQPMQTQTQTHDGANALSFDFLTKKSYAPPSWATHLNPTPSHVFSLAHLPTPIHKWNLPNLPQNTEVYLKRDDLSGMQLSGNKVRKLEFLMAEAVAQGADCIITIGGIQSNHCRATAVAAKYLNLDSYLILRTSKVLVDQDPGLTGNLLVERFVGANIQLVSKEEYARIGSEALTNVLKEKLLKEGRRPYVIPVGGSNSLGTWGYIEAIREIEEQLQISSNGVKLDDIVVACGSGGTIAGLSLGSWLGALKAKVHAFCVCDDPDYFYDYVQGLIDGLQAGVNSRDIVSILNAAVMVGHFGYRSFQAKGLGYAMNTSEELKFVKEIATATGVVLDPVYRGKPCLSLKSCACEHDVAIIYEVLYLGQKSRPCPVSVLVSGKAAYGMMKNMGENPKKWEGRKVLFIHTGGLLGLFDKVDQMAPLVGNWQRMDVNESVPRKDGIGKMF